MHQSFIVAAALAGAASAQSAASLTLWRPGPANNPSRASYDGIETATYPPVASIISSDAATTVFAIGCPTSAPLVSIGTGLESCPWANDYATYTIVSSTRHVMHITGTQPTMSAWWTCDYNSVATKMTCDIEVTGDVNDNTGGPVEGIVYPDKVGNIVAFATAEVVTTGRFGELECGFGSESSSAISCNSDGTGGKGTMSWGVGTDAVVSTGLMTASGSPPSVQATQGSGSGASATASSTATGSAATASTGAAEGFGVDAVKLAALVGGAAFAAW